MKRSTIITITGLLILLVFAPNALAAGVRAISQGNHGVKTIVNAPRGGWVGCSYWDGDGRTDLEAEYVVGRDSVRFNVPRGAVYTIVLWKEKHDYGRGPEPDNPWGRKNGYYMYGQISRARGQNR